jgi:DNA topoisomerase-1
MSKEEKEARKLDEEKKKLKYAYAVVDGTLMKVANTLIEPPGLFRGRGEHPKAGLLKPRVMPEDVTLNIGEDAPVPECPIEGHSWGRIIHNHHTTWLANWKDMSGNNKYVYLSASSHFKGQTDREKYEKARRLKKKIPEIRKNYMKGMESGDSSRDRQIATAMWIIDRLALRVGGEKEDDEADTVGTCSLRVEHIKLSDPYTMTLDFLGKDSMRHFQTYDLSDSHLEKSGFLAYKCLKSFIKDKKDTDQIFDQVDPSLLNEHLKKIMPGLTAKVFRTYNASSTLDAELPKLMPAHATVEEKESAYNDANRKVAILCNHQRTVSKAQEVGLEKKLQEITELEKQLDELRVMQKRVDAGKELLELKPDDAGDDDKKKYAYLFEKQPTSEQVEKRVAQWEKKLETLKYKTSEADKNKTVALNTSKINYMDPRISVAWAKRNEFPIEKIYSATQRDKFPWAMSEKDSFEF